MCGLILAYVFLLWRGVRIALRAADDHGTAEAGYGVRGPARVGEEGGRAVTRRTWTLTGLASRPVLRSLIVDGSDSWVVETATPDPAAEAVWVCETVLNG
jgi:hypothetical protein